MSLYKIETLSGEFSWWWHNQYLLMFGQGTVDTLLFTKLVTTALICLLKQYLISSPFWYRDGVQSILNSLPIDLKELAYGHTKIFIRSPSTVS